MAPICPLALLAPNSQMQLCIYKALGGAGPVGPAVAGTFLGLTSEILSIVGEWKWEGQLRLHVAHKHPWGSIRSTQLVRGGGSVSPLYIYI